MYIGFEIKGERNITILYLQGGDIQNPVILDSYSAVLEFKGKGNALLLFQEDGTNETHNVCLVRLCYIDIGLNKANVIGLDQDSDP